MPSCRLFFKHFKLLALGVALPTSPLLCFLFRWVGFRKPNRCSECCFTSLGRVWCTAACRWATSRSSAPSHKKVLWSWVEWFGRWWWSSPTSFFGATCWRFGGRVRGTEPGLDWVGSWEVIRSWMSCQSVAHQLVWFAHNMLCNYAV